LPCCEWLVYPIGYRFSAFAISCGSSLIASTIDAAF